MSTPDCIVRAAGRDWELRCDDHEPASYRDDETGEWIDFTGWRQLTVDLTPVDRHGFAYSQTRHLAAYAWAAEDLRAHVWAACARSAFEEIHRMEHTA